jgi:hypothetical protein
MIHRKGLRKDEREEKAEEITNRTGGRKKT